MSEPTQEASLVVIHPVLTTITDGEVAAALGAAKVGLGTRMVRLQGRSLTLSELSELDWGAAQNELAREVDGRLVPALREHAGSLHYFGMLPIPLAIELGCMIGPTRAVRAYQQRHDSKAWTWPTDTETVTVKALESPQAVCHAKGDVILRVSCSHLTRSEVARAIVPFAIGELHVDVENPHEDVLRSEADVTLVSTKIGEALDRISHLYPNCDTIHVFAAVPPALAVRIGSEINPTIHRPLQTYQYDGGADPPYVRALLVGARLAPPLTETQRENASRARTSFATALSQLQPLSAKESRRDEWLEEIFGSTAALFTPAFKKLGPLGKNKAIVGASVALDAREADGEFRFDPGKRVWIFDDRLLAALAERLDEHQIEKSARLFLLHESIHVAEQGITSATADGIGRLPRVLEEADYIADLWAQVHEYARALREGETDEARAPAFFRELLALATATFWAFDAAELPLRAIQVRRLNRYLLWYWQRLALEHADTIADVVRVLNAKPILEISGPRVSTSRGRVMLDLDPTYFQDLEFGALVSGFKVVRVGTRRGAAVDNILRALREGKETEFLQALRGVFDSIERSG